MLPDPDLLRRRHLALVLLDEALGGLEDEDRRRFADEDGLRFDDGTGDGYALAGDRLTVTWLGAAAVLTWDGAAWVPAAGTDPGDLEEALADLLEPAGDVAYRLARDDHDQPYLGSTADRFAAAVQDESRVDPALARTLRPVDGLDAWLARARALGLTVAG